MTCISYIYFVPWRIFAPLRETVFNMKYLLVFSFLLIATSAFCGDTIPLGARLLLKAYPASITSYKNNKLYFKDGSFMIYDDGVKQKANQTLLDTPDIKDQFKYSYTKGATPKKIDYLFDPGRIRNTDFFKKMYGNTPDEVKKNLVEIVWCPKLINQKIKVTKVNGVDKALQRISDELDNHPELKDYITDIGGTFNWRLIKGTQRLSMHSFGMTIDINTKFSNYWEWDCRCTNEETQLKYINKIPQLIIDIFEKNGFIWGGKWYHYDTMHFEYRPELL